MENQRLDDGIGANLRTCIHDAERVEASAESLVFRIAASGDEPVNRLNRDAGGAVDDKAAFVIGHFFDHVIPR